MASRNVRDIRTSGFPGGRPPFITTHAARAARTRQYALVIAEVERLVNGLHASGVLEKPTPRETPDRYMVQTGQVALSIAWLRGPTDLVTDGTLLVIVWRGTIAPRSPGDETRTSVVPVRTATSAWEDIVSVAAESEALWRWCSANVGADGVSSVELAGTVVRQLERAARGADADTRDRAALH